MFPTRLARHVTPLRLRSAAAIGVVICLGVSSAGVLAQNPATRPAARSATRPATQPARPAVVRPDQGPGELLRRLRDVVNQLDLSTEQQEQVERIFADTRQQGRQLMPQLRNMPPEQRREEWRLLLAGLVDEINAILTSEQKRAFRQATERLRREAQPGTQRPPRMEDNAMENPMGGAMENAMDAPTGERSQAAPPDSPAAAKDAFLQRLTAPAGLDVDQALPQDLQVVTMLGDPKPLRDYLHPTRPLVVLLGSASNPSFRDRLQDLPWLQEQLAGKAELLIVYTREQYPAGEWTVDRNEQDSIRIPRHSDLEARLDAARRTRTMASIRAPLVVDAMDDAALKTLIGDQPNSAALVFRADGTLAARQQWLDPSALPAVVENAAK